MNKSGLIDAVSKTTSLAKRDAEDAVNALVHVVSKEVRSGRRVVVAGFGSFNPTHRGARMGRNPRTGAPVSISSSSTASHFVSATATRGMPSSRAWRRLRAVPGMTLSRALTDALRQKMGDAAVKGAKAIDFQPPRNVGAIARARAQKYGWDEIDRTEAARDSARAPAMRDYRARLGVGPTITLRQSKDSLAWSYDPTELIGFDLYSTVYPSGNFSAAWGKLPASLPTSLASSWTPPEPTG